MPMTITEFSGAAAFLTGKSGAIPAESLRSQAITLTTGVAASTTALGTGTTLVRVCSDVGAYLLFGSSASTGVATSTNGMRIAPNVPEYFAVTALMRLTAVST